MKKLYLTILWHQHQPCYKDPGDGKFQMPWVYLHGLKDYYEMARHVENAGNVRVVFNYVPSLLIQLEEYLSVNAPDIFLEALRKDVRTLSQEERRLVFSQCFMANTDNMIRPLKRFSELFDKQSMASGADVFSFGELLDLEIMYILSWCGVFIRQEDDHIAYLLSKGFGFSEDDKLKLLDRSVGWIGKIKEIHRRLSDSGMAEISCTPYYHPILPLITDISSAKEVCSDMPMPSGECNFDMDADWHIAEGLNEFERQLGIKAAGMWPAEGSISQKTARKYAENGVRWIASDEEVLGNSLRVDMKNPLNRHMLYQKRFQIHDGKKINIFFRDKELSDLIGFTYSGWKTKDAVNDFIQRLKRIYDSVNFSPHVSVILDGENAWEYYKNNGFEFFTELYKALGSTDWLETQTFSQAIGNYEIPEEILTNIVAGSWIMGNFKIWIGHEEKNKAWEILSRTRRDMVKHLDGASEEAKANAFKALHAAEGSDWFWWFGDDHYSLQSDIFDKLFRTHLINVRKSLNIDIPQELFRPIKKIARAGFLEKPISMISPTINGLVTDFYEWRGCGVCDLKSDAGSMHAGGSDLKKLIYGFDKENLYIGLNTDFREKPENVLEIEVFTGTGSAEVLSVSFDGEGAESSGLKVVAGPFFEAAIPLRNHWKASKIISLSFKVKRNGAIVEKAPLYNVVEIDISNEFENEWII